jgi:RNA polymerase sigma-70 factor (ECF subfamily)
MGRQAFGLAFRILDNASAAEDVVQDAFLTIWRRSSTLDPGRGRVESLLLTVVHRRAIDVLRARRNVTPAEDYQLDRPDEGNQDPATIVDLAARREEVRAALAELPLEQREILKLAYYKGMTHVEICESEGIPLGTVKSRMRLALQKLRATLGGSGQ